MEAFILSFFKGSELKFLFITLLIFTFISSVSAHFYLSNQVKYFKKTIPQLKNSYKTLNANINKSKKKISFYSLVIDVQQLLDEFKMNVKNYSTYDLAYIIAKESKRHHIDPYLVLAMIKTESSFRIKVVSYKGAVGLMQLLPNTAYYISDKRSDLNLNNRHELFDPVANIRVGINYFAYLKDKFNGNEKYAIMAYNFGPTNLKKYLSRNYSLPSFYYNRVMANYKNILKMNNQT